LVVHECEGRGRGEEGGKNGELHGDQLFDSWWSLSLTMKRSADGAAT
jgi:hypothetical protein